MAGKKGQAKAPKRGREAAAGQAVDRRVRLAAHPRARRQIRRAKGWGGLVGFLLVGLLSLKAGAPAFDAGLRALVGGLSLYVVAWTVTVMAWRQLALAEVARARRRLADEAAARAAAQEELAA